MEIIYLGIIKWPGSLHHDARWRHQSHGGTQKIRILQYNKRVY